MRKVYNSIISPETRCQGWRLYLLFGPDWGKRTLEFSRRLKIMTKRFFNLNQLPSHIKKYN